MPCVPNFAFHNSDGDVLSRLFFPRPFFGAEVPVYREILELDDRTSRD